MATYFSGMSDEVRIGVMAHELCHALVHPEPAKQAVDRGSEVYRREDRVGDNVARLLGFSQFGEAGAASGYANWVSAEEMAAEEMVEAEEIIGYIEKLIASVSVWRQPAVAHLCAGSCEGTVHKEQLVVDERDREPALRWVTLMAAEAKIEVISLEKASPQPTPAATVWMLRYRTT